MDAELYDEAISRYNFSRETCEQGLFIFLLPFLPPVIGDSSDTQLTVMTIRQLSAMNHGLCQRV